VLLLLLLPLQSARQQLLHGQTPAQASLAL
jgi:hypothetical protein